MQSVRIDYLLVYLICIGLAGHLSGPVVNASDDVPISASPLLHDLISEGLANNQKLQSQRSKIDALFDEAGAAGALDDPRLGVALLNLPTDTFRFDQEPMTQKQVSIAQKIPWFGKLDLKSQRVLLEANKEEARWQGQRLALARKITATYYELTLTVRSEQVNTQLIELLERLLQSSESRYASGRGLQQDVLLAQVQRSRLMDEQYQLVERRHTLNSRLNELLNRSDFQAMAAEDDIQLPILNLDRVGLNSRSLEDNPDVRVLTLTREQNDVAISLARKSFYPDFDARMAYGFRDDDRNGEERADFLSIGLNLNIPLWQKKKQKPRLEAAIKRRKAAEQSLRELRISLPHRIDALVNAIERLTASHTLYTNTLLLQAVQWAESAQSAYEVGKLEFNSLINARIQVLRFNLQADTYKFRIYQKRAELEELIGSPL